MLPFSLTSTRNLAPWLLVGPHVVPMGGRPLYFLLPGKVKTSNFIGIFLLFSNHIYVVGRTYMKVYLQSHEYLMGRTAKSSRGRRLS